MSRERSTNQNGFGSSNNRSYENGSPHEIEELHKELTDQQKPLLQIKHRPRRHSSKSREKKLEQQLELNKHSRNDSLGTKQSSHTFGPALIASTYLTKETREI